MMTLPGPTAPDIAMPPEAVAVVKGTQPSAFPGAFAAIADAAAQTPAEGRAADVSRAMVPSRAVRVMSSADLRWAEPSEGLASDIKTLPVPASLPTTAEANAGPQGIELAAPPVPGMEADAGVPSVGNPIDEPFVASTTTAVMEKTPAAGGPETGLVKPPASIPLEASESPSGSVVEPRVPNIGSENTETPGLPGAVMNSMTDTESVRPAPPAAAETKSTSDLAPKLGAVGLPADIGGKPSLQPIGVEAGPPMKRLDPIVDVPRPAQSSDATTMPLLEQGRSVETGQSSSTSATDQTEKSSGANLSFPLREPGRTPTLDAPDLTREQRPGGSPATEEAAVARDQAGTKGVPDRGSVIPVAGTANERATDSRKADLAPQLSQTNVEPRNPKGARSNEPASVPNARVEGRLPDVGARAPGTVTSGGDGSYAPRDLRAATTLDPGALYSSGISPTNSADSSDPVHTGPLFGPKNAGPVQPAGLAGVVASTVQRARADIPSDSGRIGRQAQPTGEAPSKPFLVQSVVSGSSTSDIAATSLPDFNAVLGIQSRDGQPGPIEPGLSVEIVLGERGIAETPRTEVMTPKTPELHRPAIVQIIEAMRGGPGTFDISLSPEELGRLTLTIGTQDGSIMVNVAAERGETLDLIRRHIDVLYQEARDAGFEGLAFSFGDNRGAPEEQKGLTGHASPPASEDTPPGRGTLAQQTPTATGTLDIRL